jgi:hypothetical protein
VSTDKESRNLYRFQYYEPLDEATYVDWVWLEPHEVSDYRSSSSVVKVREATTEEEELYNEAYADGYGIAAVMEFESKHNGVTFRVELDESLEDFNYTKMFQCSSCLEHKDFDTQVATANGFYITELKENDTLWHVCYDCAMLNIELGGIKLDIAEEGETDS